jgi:hypothetical protein
MNPEVARLRKTKMIETIADCLQRIGASGWENMAETVLEDLKTELEAELEVDCELPLMCYICGQYLASGPGRTCENPQCIIEGGRE